MDKMNSTKTSLYLSMIYLFADVASVLPQIEEKENKFEDLDNE